MRYEQPAESPRSIRDDLFPAKVYQLPIDIPQERPLGALINPADEPPKAPRPQPLAVPKGSTLLHRPARVVLTGDTVHIFIDGTYGPEEAFQAKLLDLQGDRKIGFTATVNTDPPQTLLIQRDPNHCGCGSRLRQFRPFKQMQMRASSSADRTGVRRAATDPKARRSAQPQQPQPQVSAD